MENLTVEELYLVVATANPRIRIKAKDELARRGYLKAWSRKRRVEGF